MMSNVSRSVYQKLKEENKRLLHDIKILCGACDDVKERIDKGIEWRQKFKDEGNFHGLLRVVSEQYVKDHPEEFKFLKDHNNE